MSSPNWQTTIEPGQDNQGASSAESERPIPGLLLVAAAGQPAFAPCPVGSDEVELGRTHSTLSAYPDSMMSRQHARVAFRDGAFSINDLGSRNGSALNGQTFSGTLRAEPGAVLRLGHSLFLLCDDLRPLYRHGIRMQDGRVEGPALQRLVRTIAGIAQHSRTLFIVGESGSGKEALAQTFHQSGPRRDGPFIAVNCATLPEGVAERLLFGAQKGAYSGATAASDGYLQAASGGTLFLDELGDLDLAVQAKFLRTIENGEVTALGATRPRKIDVRLCSATHADLRTLVSQGKFRADLYFRLGMPQVRVPPLRERREEVPWLLAQAVSKVAPTLQLRVAMIESCLLRPWPGNIRELLAEAHTAAMAALADGSNTVGPEHMSATAGQTIVAASLPAPHGEPLPTPLPEEPEELPDVEDAEEAELPATRTPPSRAQLVAILIECKGNLSATARALSLHRTQLRRYLLRYGIDPSRVRDISKAG